MSKSPEAPESTPPTMSPDALLELIARMNSDASDRLAKALIESRKPWTDPKQEENEQFMRNQERAQRERTALATKAYQENCPHLAGSNPLSDQSDLLGRTCIIWHTSDVGETFGICSNCQRVFRENEADYATWRRKPSINKQSRAGERQFADPIAARRTARGEI
jgi:hypothetical protein